MTGLQPGQRGIDFATRPDADAGIKANGAAFIVRYSAGANNTTADRQFKLCGPSEVHDAVAAGLDFLANYEDGPDTLVSATPAQMAEAGKADLDFWQSRGYAEGAVLLCSWDSGQPNPGLHDTLARNLDAYYGAQGEYYARGLYAGDVAIAAMLNLSAIGYGWRAMSDAWSNDGEWYLPGADWAASATKLATVSRAHLAQNGNRWYGAGADEDVVLRAGLPSHLSQLGAVPTLPPPAPSPAVPPRPPAPPSPAQTSYTVRQGDTLSAIAARFHTSWQALAALNHLRNPDLIYPGQVLTIDGVAAPQRTYTVRQGDTLSGIAASHGTTWQRLAGINHLLNPDLIYPGQSLVLG